MPRTPAHQSIELCTGSHRSRTTAQLLHLGRFPLYGRIGGPLSHEFDAGGPLDAPSTLPAGSMNSTDCRDGYGRPIPWQTETMRP